MWLKNWRNQVRTKNPFFLNHPTLVLSYLLSIVEVRTGNPMGIDSLCQHWIEESTALSSSMAIIVTEMEIYQSIENYSLSPQLHSAALNPESGL
jgi:galactokinase